MERLIPCYARAPSPQRNGGIWPGRSGGHGVRSSTCRYPNRRRSRPDHARVDGYMEAVGDHAGQAARLVALLSDDPLCTGSLPAPPAKPRLPASALI